MASSTSPCCASTQDDDFEAPFAAATRKHADGVVVFGCNIIAVHLGKIVELAARYRLPAMYASRAYVAYGGLMSYGPSLPAIARRAAVYMDKILKGAKPADLPVEQPMLFKLVINLKTAKALGITIPPSLLILANEVIE